MSNTSTNADGPEVLIVDDTPANLDLLTKVLEPGGYRVLAATDGEIALRIVERRGPN